MKRIFVMLAAMAALVSCGSNSAVVKTDVYGAIDNLESVGKVYLVDMWDARNIIDSVKIEGTNTFHFKEVQHAQTFASLMLENDRPIAMFFLDGGNVRISGDYTTGEINPSGTLANDALVAMMKRDGELRAQYRQAMANKDVKAAEAIDEEHTAMQNEFYNNNKGNVFGIFMLKQLSYSMSAKEMLDELATLSAEMQAWPMVVKMKENSERKLKTEPQVEGSDYVPHYIDIVQPNIDGEEVSLKSVVESEKNRYVLLDFWWSAAVEEMPVLKRAYSLYHDKGFEIYGASLDRRKDFWKEAIDVQGIEWITVSTLEEFNTKAVEDYAVEPKLLPNFLIDCSNGTIIAKNLRGKALLAKLDELLK
jgi:hypothetical protein